MITRLIGIKHWSSTTTEFLHTDIPVAANINNSLWKKDKQQSHSGIIGAILRVADIAAAKVPLDMPSESPLNAHVLLVEDYPANVLIARTLLDLFGCTYLLAKNGKEALALVKTHIFDMVFMDVQMPILDGFTATGLIRKWEKEQSKPANVIIGVTARALAGDRDMCLNAGMNDYISKPYSPATFHEKIVKYKRAIPQQLMKA